MTTSPPVLDRLLASAMVLAPALLLAATLSALPSGDFTESVPQGVLQMFSMGAFFLAALGVVRLVADALPRLSTLLLATAAIGTQAGVAFGVVIIARAKGLELQSGALEAAFNTPGVLFPMTWLALGAALRRTGTGPSWAATTLMVAGLAFPVSRIGAVAEIAVVADLLFLVGLSGVAGMVLRRQAVPSAQPALA